MKIAIEGCCHNELDSIYESLQSIEKKTHQHADVLLIAGDFQAIRNSSDLECLSVPEKFRKLGDFSSYYSGIKKAPILTIFIGGNHEASNYLWELYYGGWVCPNIYYMGAANIINIGGLRIAGLSGIYKEKDYIKGHFERVPYNMTTLRSVYHVRKFEVSKLLNIPETTHIDIFLSHDWPRGIEKYGDWKKLLSKKPYFFNDIQNNCLGSLPNEKLMNKLQPTYWFAAHLHVKFEAIKRHDMSENVLEDQKNKINKIVKNPDEIDLDDNSVNESECNSTDIQSDLNDKKETSYKATRFLALDKCLPGRHFLEILDIPTAFDSTNEKLKLLYDADWLAICRVFHPYFSVEYDQIPIPEDKAYLEREIEKEKAWVQEHIVHSCGLEIPLHFEHTAPVEESTSSMHCPRMKIYILLNIN
ncbi:hypothetical protein PCANB_002649 [Pneumocystis canis]|nr:hypothetical protein PCK1_002701 [Pneumocystis canis]KAG5438545.1 hypothetical protein PCANB_002649 [Pneumocystis canis]